VSFTNGKVVGQRGRLVAAHSTTAIALRLLAYVALHERQASVGQSIEELWSRLARQ
jgi:hypothetical protein